jgi:signal transduction histidine kinase
MTKHRRELVRTLNARTQRLERENQTERALAAADERNRLAREMHDIVAHSLSVMIAQADGGRYAIDSHPDLAKESLATIASTGRDALAEMRTLLGILRQDDDAALRPAPTLSDIPDLLQNAEHSGIAVDYLEERLREANGKQILPAGAQLTLYRATQEGLTNVIKHAGPAVTAKVIVRWGVDGVRLIVRDNGRGGLAVASDSMGQGLRGVRERVEHFGGSVFAGPDLAGGFRLEVFVPYAKVNS